MQEDISKKLSQLEAQIETLKGKIAVLENSRKDQLSKMNMAGMGLMMINYLMKKQGVLSPDQLFI